MVSGLLTFTPLAKAFADGGTKNAIPVTQAVELNGLASLTTGFPPENSAPVDNGGVPPNRADMNGALYLATQYDYFLQNGGVRTFEESVSTAIGGYPAGAVLYYVEEFSGNYRFRVLRSLADNNTANFNTNPAYINDGEHWQDITLNESIPGNVIYTARTTTPDGYLLCDGAAVSRTTYADLFNAIGVTYGSGNGTTTFNVPNLINRYIKGSATVATVLAAGLPNITGTIYYQARNDVWTSARQANNPFYKSDSTTSTVSGDNNQSTYYTVKFNASRSNSIYGAATTVQPPSLTLRPIIKY